MEMRYRNLLGQHLWVPDFGRHFGDIDMRAASLNGFMVIGILKTVGAEHTRQG